MPRYDELADRELALLAREDHAALDVLYRRHVTAVYRYCYARTGSVADAEDVTAQTFLAALETLDRYRGRGTVLAWLFGIARHKCADMWRSRQGMVDADWEAAAAARGAVSGADPAPQPEAAANCALIIDCVERMLPQLSADRQEALQLHYWGGLAYRDVARAMRRSVAAVKMLISRGIVDLRKRCLDDEAEYQADAGLEARAGRGAGAEELGAGAEGLQTGPSSPGRRADR